LARWDRQTPWGHFYDEWVMDAFIWPNWSREGLNCGRSSHHGRSLHSAVRALWKRNMSHSSSISGLWCHLPPLLAHAIIPWLWSLPAILLHKIYVTQISLKYLFREWVCTATLLVGLLCSNSKI
jgi:hypothetical protein